MEVDKDQKLINAISALLAALAALDIYLGIWHMWPQMLVGTVGWLILVAYFIKVKRN